MIEKPHFSVLGSLAITRSGRPVELTTPRLRVLLASLLLHANRPLSTNELADRMWSGRAPEQPRRAVQLYVVRLRRLLRDERLIRTSPAGYLIQVDRSHLDLLRFESLVAEADRAADVSMRDHLLTEALELWQGPVCADVNSDVLHTVDVPPLQERRLVAEEALIEAKLSLGQHAAQVPRLRQLVAEHPLRERFSAQLLLALFRSGRQAEALEVYRTTAKVLDDELGVAPGPELSRLRDAILTASPPLAASVPPALTLTTPSELPATTATFVGRSSELALLLSLPALSANPSAAVSIGAIDGMPGVGKTALAVHAAHQLSPLYPDGQIFLDLHGHSEGLAPLSPWEALDRILRALGIPGMRIPSGLDGRSALFRSTLAGRKMLIVLDNAHSENQIAPLLPGQPDSLVLVTSRRMLTGLDNVRQLSLGVLPRSEAISLFLQLTDRSRLADSSVEIVDEIAGLCGDLPLAIRLAAARLRSRPAWTAEHLVNRLRNRHGRLAGLGDRELRVDVAFAMSYQQLAPDRQAAFRLIGSHPGTDLDVYAAAALFDAGLHSTRRLLDEFVDIHLMQEPRPGRYQLHDLIHAYASTLETAADERRAAVTRLLGYYARATMEASESAFPLPSDDESYGRLPMSRSPVPTFVNRRAAEAWLDTEVANLLAAAALAVADGDGDADYLLTQSVHLHRYLVVRGRYADAVELHSHALAFALLAKDRASQCAILYRIGLCQLRLGRYVEAQAAFERSLRAALDSSYRKGELDARRGLGHAHRARGNSADAARSYDAALAIARDLGDGSAELDVLRGLGELFHHQGLLESAIDHYQLALRVARRMGDRDGELDALSDIGTLYLLLARYDLAAEQLRPALELARAEALVGRELRTLRVMGLLQVRQGAFGQAEDLYQRALTMARRMGDQSAEQAVLCGIGELRLRTDDLDQAAASYQLALTMALEIDNENGRFDAVHGLGRTHQAAGRTEEALSYHQQALTIAGRLDQRIDVARAHHGIARAYASLHRPAPARRHFEAALKILASFRLDAADDLTAAGIRAGLAALDPPDHRRFE